MRGLRGIARAAIVSVPLAYAWPMSLRTRGIVWTNRGANW